MTPLVFIAVTIPCLLTGALAVKKGYNFFLWFLVLFGCSILGPMMLATLPNVNEEDLSETEIRKKTKVGNIIGGVMTAIALVQFVLIILQR